MVTRPIFPGACYGLAPLERTGVPGRDYGILHAGPGFPPEAEKALEQMARGVEWKSDGEAESYPPCFALWPTGRGVMAIRIRDVGRDDRERPHAIRIEAAYIEDRAILDDPDRLAGLLDDSAWPPNGWDWTKTDAIELGGEGSTRIGERPSIIESMKSEPRSRLLIAGRHLKADEEDYDEVFTMEGGEAIARRSRRDGRLDVKKTETWPVSGGQVGRFDRRSSEAREGRTRRFLLPTLLAAAVGLLFTAFSAYSVYRNSLKKLGDAHQQITNLNAEIERLKSLNTKISNNNEQLESQVFGLQQYLAKANAQPAEFEEINGSAQSTRPVESNERARLGRENRRLVAILSQLKDSLKIINKQLDEALNIPKENRGR
jgi:cell division protein FtsB